MEKISFLKSLRAKILIRFLSSKTCRNYYTRQGVKNALIEIGAPAVNSLIATLKVEDSVLRIDAAEILGRIRDKRAVEPLIEVLKDNMKREISEARIAMAAAEALGKIRDKRAVELLLQSLREGTIGTHFLSTYQSPANVPESAAKALGEIGDKKAIGPLIQLLKDKKFIKAYAYSEIGEESAKPFHDAIEDLKNSCRKEAVKALEKITGKSFGQDIEKWWVWWEQNKEY